MRQPSQTTPWLMPLSREPHGRLNLFFFPHAGGGASVFHPWSRVLPAGITCHAVQLPGREMRIRERPYRQLWTAVHALSNVLSPFLAQPFLFWGHSMGALLAYEVAQSLRQHGLEMPQRLIVSGYNAPHIPYADPHIHHLPEDEFVAAVQALNGTPVEVLEHEELRNLVLPTVRADFQMVETYSYQEAIPLDCPITVLAGREDPKTDEAGIAAWQAHTSRPLDLFTFPGDHFFLYDLQPPLVNTVNQLLTNQLRHAIQR